MKQTHAPTSPDASRLVLKQVQAY